MEASTVEIKKKRDRIGVILYVIYVLLLLASVLLFVKIVGIQIFFKPDPKIETALTPSSRPRYIEPVRGNIIDCQGRLLAMSCPTYQIAMDCTVRREEFAKDKDGAAKEAAWMKKAGELSVELAKVFPEKSAEEYLKLIRNGRANGKKYLRIGKPVDRNVYNRVASFPLFKEGRYRGGFIAEQQNVRIYPYGKLARRTIGFVRNNRSDVGNTHVGLEGKFDFVLHGREGKEWLKVTDAGRVVDNDSTKTRPEDGKDIRTTLNIDYQDIAWRSLYNEICAEDDLEGACLVLMETGTGAIRAMVNLYRDGKSTDFEEVSNLAIGRAIEPGSVFKTVTLMQVLSDGYVKSLDETIPTNHGVIKGVRGVPQDVHMLDHERVHHTNSISIIDGFKISSNYVFGSLAVSNYSKKPMRFIENIHSYHLGEAFAFDLDGLATPTVPSPKDKNRYWSLSDLAVMGYGYGTRVTPLHVLSFYNAIANKGKMMKPYLVEDIELNGEVKNKRGPALMSTICSKAVADTITRALKAVTEEGTARRLKDARCTVAGKTGTSFGTYSGGSYRDEMGRRKYQGTFVGFFPAEEPRYSVICTVFSKPTSKQFQGGGIPARAIKNLVNGIYCIDPCFQPELSASK
ncbi:MAG: penicillin-binding protein 2 [Bacteroidales bacterium]|nr:penicillin-binding protein 2 [Bacteroidales bacterium]